MATTYYVDGAVGNDSNSGTSEGSGNALLTLTAGLAKITSASDRLYIKASVTYAETGTINSGYTPNFTTPSIVEGYTSTPGDGGQITITGSSSRSYGLTGSKAHYVWRNIKIIDCNHTGFNMSSGYHNVFENCYAENITSRGFYLGQQVRLFNCEAHDCDYSSVQVSTGSTLINCYITGTAATNYPCIAGNYCRFFNSIFVGGTSYGLRGAANTTVVNCVFDGGGTKIGLYCSSNYYQTTVINSIFYNCTTGIYMYYKYPNDQFGYGNVMYGNTANYYNWSATDDDITGQNPGFTDAANGDYSISSSSPAVGIGLPDRGGEEKMDSGAYQTALPSGGGTSRIILTS